jgi:cytochrome c peroxidase
MRKLIYLSLILTGSLVLFFSCSKEQGTEVVAMEPRQPASPYDYSAAGLPGYARVSTTSADNQVAALGRVLFYDKALSLNNSVSCASCHKQQLAFSDNAKGSLGFRDQSTPRNSMAIMNTGVNQGYFWDLRQPKLQSMVTMPVKNHIEMGFSDINHMAAQVRQRPYYASLFASAFGSAVIDTQRIQVALMTFVSSLASYGSKYDKGIATGFANFTGEELRGRQLFTQELHCGMCHVEPEFGAGWPGAAANIGLDLVYADKGVGANGIQSGPESEGTFKIPTLRNIELTAPYMHDGRFKTLEEVIEHYNSGVKANPFVDWVLKVEHPSVFVKRQVMPFDLVNMGNSGAQINKPVKLNLTPADKKALVAFLRTLTDMQFITNPKYSDPFVTAGLQ